MTDSDCSVKPSLQVPDKFSASYAFTSDTIQDNQTDRNFFKHANFYYMSFK